MAGDKMTSGIGERFQEETKYLRDKMEAGYMGWSSQPEPYKRYAESKKINLYHPDDITTMTLTDALKERRSERDYSHQPLTMEQLSYLLWACGGSQREEEGFEFRTAPSAGGLYPIETYVIVNRVDGVEQGVYHYAVRRHQLEQIKKGSFGREIAIAALDQRMCMEAAAVFAWAAVFQRSKWKYRQRAYRYVYLDAGHMGENLALALVALGLGGCQIGALYDQEVNEILGLDGKEESIVYMSTAGVPK